jgi:UDP-N-acetylmuramyl pentapeptide phosphotransferase/UDP-N-acetylglucosamine-1-phosphate transferase
MNGGQFVAPGIALTASALAVWLLKRRARLLPPDLPNDRSLHATPVPRAGGYAVWTGFLLATFVDPPGFPGGLTGWLPAFLALAVVSAIDDVREVRVVPRLAVHALAALWSACWLVLAGLGGTSNVPSWVAIPLIALAMAWSLNLYNFMDGNDGLAATMGIVGFAAYGIASVIGAASPEFSVANFAPACFALVAALVPFLLVNLPRASMFLGDVGAVPLGFLAAVFGVGGYARDIWPAWFPLLVFLPFIADATLTLVRRAHRRERIFEGHRTHFYQRLHQLGAGHAGTLGVYAAMMIGCATTGLACLARDARAGWWALVGWIAVVCMLFATIDYHWRKKTNIPAHSPP